MTIFGLFCHFYPGWNKPIFLVFFFIVIFFNGILYKRINIRFLPVFTFIFYNYLYNDGTMTPFIFKHEGKNTVQTSKSTFIWRVWSTLFLPLKMCPLTILIDNVGILWHQSTNGLWQHIYYSWNSHSISYLEKIAFLGHLLMSRHLHW